MTEDQHIDDEIDRLVSECECPHKFEVTKVAERKYRVSSLRFMSLVVGR